MTPPTTRPRQPLHLVLAAQTKAGPGSAARRPFVPKLWHAVEMRPDGPAGRALCGWQYNQQWLYANLEWSVIWKPRCPYCEALAA